MYRDKTLLPTEAIRMAALGTLAVRALSYSALAREVRGFASRIAGPSLDILGNSIELLRFEGLVAASDADEDPLLSITARGRDALNELLMANVRSPVDGVGKLIVALKLRFLHLLPPADRAAQIALMRDASAAELVRLQDLRERYAAEPGLLCEWLDHDMRQVQATIDWLEALTPTPAAAATIEAP